jgi:hypothetical protein
MGSNPKPQKVMSFKQRNSRTAGKEARNLKNIVFAFCAILRVIDCRHLGHAENFSFSIASASFSKREAQNEKRETKKRKTKTKHETRKAKNEVRNAKLESRLWKPWRRTRRTRTRTTMSTAPSASQVDNDEREIIQPSKTEHGRNDYGLL